MMREMSPIASTAEIGVRGNGLVELAAHVRDLLEAVDVLGLHEAQIVTQGRHALIERMPTMSATTPMQTAATTVFASRLRSPK
jgi:hypothetical protein